MARAEVRIELGAWKDLAREATPIRHAVFVAEQGVPVEIELDEWDAVSLHAIARDSEGRAIGTGRLLPDGHIGRMAVLKGARGGGAGTSILLALMDAARQRGHREVVLNAQTHAAPFYRRLGFVEEGDVFDDAGIPHIAMRRAL
ncbi:MAG: GNAT family N-acetyltransferase [Pseudomonadota bacterium]